MPFNGSEVSSSFQKRPAYRYIRRTDRLPTYAQIPDIPFSRIPVKVKLFNPTGIGTWYIAAYDPDTHIAWGLADLHEKEVGSFSMDELVAFRGRFGLPIERDLYWHARSLADVQGRSRRRHPQSRAQRRTESGLHPGRKRTKDDPRLLSRTGQTPAEVAQMVYDYSHSSPYGYHHHLSHPYSHPRATKHRRK